MARRRFVAVTAAASMLDLPAAVADHELAERLVILSGLRMGRGQ